LGTALDRELQDRGFPGFVTIRRSATVRRPAGDGKVVDVRSPAVTELMALITAHDRSSQASPPLDYVTFGVPSAQAAPQPRDHVVYGRRGAGKTSLLLNAKREIEARGDLAFWGNLHVLRDLPVEASFLQLADDLLHQALAWLQNRRPGGQGFVRASRSLEQVRSMRDRGDRGSRWREVVPAIHEALRFLTEELGVGLYVFLDDFHYVAYDHQPVLLDALHGCKRDLDCWLKIATVYHYTHLYTPSPPTGLQIGHDAEGISLDVTLEEPATAHQFLCRVLGTFATAAGIESLGSLAYDRAFERLTLASAGVPRDFLVLFRQAVEESRSRASERPRVGTEDVHRAAGRLRASKERDLQEDGSAGGASSGELEWMLARVRTHCMKQQDSAKCYSFLLVEQRPQQRGSEQYNLLQRLVDLRLVHLLHSGFANKHHAGIRYEAYMLDVSQYAGDRLKRNMWVLDLEDGVFTLSWKGRKDKCHPQRKRVGRTAAQLRDILREGQVLDLS